MKMTQAMQKLVDAAGESDARPDAAALEVLASGFTLSEGCLLLTDGYEQNRHLHLDQFEDRVAFECVINAVELATAGTLITGPELAIAVVHAVEALRIELLTASPPGEVRVIGSVDPEERTATLRFYMRDPEDLHWIDFEEADESGRAVLIADFD